MATAARAKDGHKHIVNRIHHDEASIGERVADRLATGIGSWTFLGIQSLLIAVWIGLNAFGLFVAHWDPYPFILLNLAFTVQAAYTGPVLLLAGNRQAQKDRLRLEHAAEQAEETDRHTIEVLKEIARNTEVTLQIAERIKAQRDQSRAAH